MLFDISEHHRRLAELDRFRIETLRETEAFADTAPTEDETRRLGNARSKNETGRNSLTIRMRLASSCAGWAERPTNAEFYDAVRAVAPSERERAIDSFRHLCSCSLSSPMCRSSMSVRMCPNFPTHSPTFCRR